MKPRLTKTGSSHLPEREGVSEAVILIKAAPHVGAKHGETVCCAGLDIYGNWLRMYPVSFRTLEDAQKFKRWDRVRFHWRLPNDDKRIESRRVDQQTLEIIGHQRKAERASFIAGKVVTSLDKERENGRSLALLKPQIQKFKITKKSSAEIDLESKKFEEFRKQQDLFQSGQLTPL